MEFSTKTVGNVTTYYINEKEVTAKTYFSLMEEQESSDFGDSENCDECPRCSMIREIAEEIMDCDSVEEAFDELNELVDFFEEIAYQTAYKEALRNQAEMLLEIANKLDEEE